MLQEKCFPASALEILSYASKAKVPSRVLSFVNKQANKQTYKQGLRWILGAIFLEFQKKIPGQVVVNLSSCPGKASGEGKQLCFKACPYEHPPQGREPDFREGARKPTVPEDVYLGYGWHLKERDRKEKKKKKNRKLQFCQLAPKKEVRPSHGLLNL